MAEKDRSMPGASGTPMADEVLAERQARQDEGFAPSQSEQIAALRSEVERLRDSIQQIASGSSQLASAEFRELTNAAEERLKRNVFLSVGMAALVGYLWGRTR